MIPNTHKGSKFKKFLEGEGLLNDTEVVAIKRIIAYELKRNMDKKNISKCKMAERMNTS